MMTTFLMIIALSGITETVTGGKCPNVSSGSSCGVFRICPHPHSDEWKCLKSTMNCNENNGQYYHCAKDVNGCYVQHCAKRVYCNSGQQPLLDLTEDTAKCQTCPAEEYQRRSFWSNEQRECDYSKTKCDGVGEIECHPGTPTEDRTCRCDIHKNLALQGYAYNKRTCCSKDSDHECYCILFKDQCPPGTVRHYNYKCLPECPQGLYRQMDIEDCIAENSSSQTYVTSTGQMPLQDSQVSTGIIIGIISIVVTVLVAAGYNVLRTVLIYCLKCRQQRRQNPDANEDINYHEVHRDPSEMMQLLPEQKDLSDDSRMNKDAGIRQIIRIHAPGAHINFGDNNNMQASVAVRSSFVIPESDVQETSFDLPGETQREVSIIEPSIGDSFMQDGGEYTSALPFTGTPESRDLRVCPFSTEEVDVSMNPEGETQRGVCVIEPSIGDSFMQDGGEYTSALPFTGTPESRDLRACPFSTEEVDVSMNPEGETQREVSIIEPSIGDSFMQDGGEYTSALPFTGTPECHDAHQRAKPLEPRLPVQEDVPMNPEESRQEEGIPNDETSMETEPKIPVEHDDLDPDDQTKKKEVWSTSVEADDQTKKKEVWSASVESDDQTKKKEVWSTSVEPDDQTKKKEVWSASLESDEQTKKKEVWSVSVESDDQTKKKQVWSASVESDEQTKKKEVWSASVESNDQTMKKEVWSASVESDDQTLKKEVWSASVESDDQTMKKEVWSASVESDDQTLKKEVWSASVESDDQTMKKEVWSASVESDDQTKKKEVWSASVEPDDQTKKKEVWSASVEPDDQTKKKEV